MSTNLHTAIAHGAAATHDTFNAPLAQLDTKINPTVAEYEDTTTTTTTVTTAGTFYAVSSFEVSFTPAYTGQVFTIHVVAGTVYADAGLIDMKVRITDGAGTTVLDNLIYERDEVDTSGARCHFSGSRTWSAAAGDVGNTRKAKVYVSHTVSGKVVNHGQKFIQAVTH